MILQGEFDDRQGLPSAKMLNKKLLERGIDSPLIIYPNAIHVLPHDTWELSSHSSERNFLDYMALELTLQEAQYLNYKDFSPRRS